MAIRAVISEQARELEFIAQRLQALGYLRMQRDAIAQALLGALGFRLSCDHDALGAGRTRRRVQCVDVLVL